MLSDMWAHHANELCERGYRVLLFDFYGHGYSSCNPRLRYDLDLFVEQTAEVLDILCSDNPPVLAGFSLGGLVAAVYTARYPHRVARLCLIDSCGFAAPPLPLSCFPAYLCHGIYSAVRTTPIRQLSGFSGGLLLEGFANAYNVTQSDVMHAFEAIRHFHGFFGITYASLWLLLISWSYQMRFGNRGLVYKQFLNNFDPVGSFSPAISKISAGFSGRVLLVWGEKDTLVPHHLCTQWVKAIPTAELITVPNADHNVPLQQPDMLSEAFQVLLSDDLVAQPGKHSNCESTKVA